MKSTTSITIDSDLLDQIRKENINLSAWVSLKLAEFFNMRGELSHINMPLTPEEAYLLADNMQKRADAIKSENEANELETSQRLARISEIHHELNELTKVKMTEIDIIKLGLLSMKQEALQKELDAFKKV